jgi:hypothetical protein
MEGRFEMTKKELWAKYAEKNPSFDGLGTVTMSARGLRKMFNQTWDIAFEAGFNQEFEDDEEEDDYPEPIKHNVDAMNIFDTIFGKR